MMACRFLIFLCCIICSSWVFSDSTFSGSVGLELRAFTEESDTSISGFLNPEWQWSSSDGAIFFELDAFIRKDDLDSKRSDSDIREALLTYSAGSWELSAGIGKVFWGVTESNHLVDVINQTDLSTSPDGETKLGQTMLRWSTSQGWGIVDVFLLPTFRERRFSDIESPLSAGLAVSEEALYESSSEDKHLDFALRYSQFFGDWDVGVYYFEGTNREPILLATDNLSGQFTPFYDQISQAGLSVQATIDAWLWKLELIHRNDSLASFEAAVGGLEYTRFGIFESAADLGFLFEYNYDNRSLNMASLLQDDYLLASD